MYIVAVYFYYARSPYYAPKVTFWRSFRPYFENPPETRNRASFEVSRLTRRARSQDAKNFLHLAPPKLALDPSSPPKRSPFCDHFRTRTFPTAPTRVFNVLTTRSKPAELEADRSCKTRDLDRQSGHVKGCGTAVVGALSSTWLCQAIQNSDQEVPPGAKELLETYVTHT